MYVLKNAMRNIRRNQGRNSLMVLLIFSIVLATSVSIIINTAVEEVIQDYRNRFGTEVTLLWDFEKVMEMRARGEEATTVTNSQLLAFGESDLLHAAAYSMRLPMVYRGLTSVVESPEENVIEETVDMIQDLDGNVVEAPKFLNPNGNIFASTGDDLIKDFELGLRNIVYGRFFEGLNECMISEELAELNHLSIGDTITVENLDATNPLPHELVIVGIFEDFTMMREDELWKTFATTHRANEILISLETLLGMDVISSEFDGALETRFYLREPDLLDEFHKELIELGLPDHYRVRIVDESTYHAIIGPVENLSEIFSVFTFMVLIFGGVVLLFISLFFIRERKYEIGVLRSMGVKKSKVAQGLIYESLGITSLGLILGLSLALVISQPVADRMLAAQIEMMQQQNKAGNFIVEINEDTPTALSELEIQLSLSSMGHIIGVALFLSTLSGGVGVLYLMKHEPMKVLSERN